MNCLLVLPAELTSPDRAVIVGERARSVQAAHDLKPGLTVAAGVRGGKLGEGTVRALDPDRCVVELSLRRDPPARLPAELIVAVPRPQTVKKVIHLACALGAARLHFIRTLKTVKSYLQSSALEPGAIEAEILLGLEQAVDTVGPEVVIHRSFEQFAVGELQAITARSSGRFFADTRADVDRLTCREGVPLGAVALAIGPEAGWSDKERASFEAAHFRALSLGERMLRVDTAALVALTELDLLRRSGIEKPL